MVLLHRQQLFTQNSSCRDTPSWYEYTTTVVTCLFSHVFHAWRRHEAPHRRLRVVDFQSVVLFFHLDALDVLLLHLTAESTRRRRLSHGALPAKFEDTSQVGSHPWPDKRHFITRKLEATQIYGSAYLLFGTWWRQGLPLAGPNPTLQTISNSLPR